MVQKGVFLLRLVEHSVLSGVGTCRRPHRQMTAAWGLCPTSAGGTRLSLPVSMAMTQGMHHSRGWQVGLSRDVACILGGEGKEGRGVKRDCTMDLSLWIYMLKFFTNLIPIFEKIGDNVCEEF